MIESVFVVLLVTALWLSRVSLFDEVDAGERIIASTTGTMLWSVLAFASLGIEVRTGTELTTVTSEPVAWICLIAAFVLLADAIPSAIELLDERNRSTDTELQ